MSYRGRGFRHNGRSSRRGGPGRHYHHAGRPRQSVSGTCMFCRDESDVSEKEDHTRKQCPLFKSLKKHTTYQPYIDTKLKPCDATGYASAGILPWRRTDSDGGLEFLLAREYRSGHRNKRGGDLLNFLGGKRLKRSTDALTCAVDKMDAETGEQLQRATVAQMRSACPLVCWSNESLYVLFLFELLGDDDCEVDVRCAGQGSDGVKRLEWATRDELLDRVWTRQNMHTFAIEMLSQLTGCSVMQHLEQLFDAVAKSELESHSKRNAAPLDGKGKSPSEVADFFDVKSAIRSSLMNFQPDHPSLAGFANHRPTFQHLQRAVDAIPPRDFRKLKRRYHPDRLRRVLERCPTSAEHSLATKAMQILNGFTDTNNSEETITSGLQELEKQCRGLASIGGTDEDDSTDALSEVKELLSNLSLRKK